MRRTAVRRQGIYWVGTISEDSGWIPELPRGIVYIKGQLEEGTGGFRHYQVMFVSGSKCSLQKIKQLFHPVIGHWELSRSSAADAYVWKEETRVGEQ